MIATASLLPTLSDTPLRAAIGPDLLYSHLGAGRASHCATCTESSTLAGKPLPFGQEHVLHTSERNPIACHTRGLVHHIACELAAAGRKLHATVSVGQIGARDGG